MAIMIIIIVIVIARTRGQVNVRAMLDDVDAQMQRIKLPLMDNVHARLRQIMCVRELANCRDAMYLEHCPVSTD